MKTKIKNFILLTFILSLCACSSDDGDSSPIESPEGSWLLISLSIETAFDFDNDGTAQSDMFDETPCYSGNFVSFDSEGGARLVNGLTYISADVNSNDPSDYEYIYECQNGFDVETSWTQNGNTVTIQLLGQDVLGTISGNTMTVVISDLFEIELYDGINYTDVQEDVTLIYSKM